MTFKTFRLVNQKKSEIILFLSAGYHLPYYGLPVVAAPAAEAAVEEAAE